MNNPELVASYLMHDGAILSLGDDQAQRFLVGFLVWLGRNRVFWFAANGDDPKMDGHILTFDEARVEKPSEITFRAKDGVVARLTAIDSSGLADADDLRAAWQVWQQRRPACERLIGASLTHHVTTVGS
jgi:hypothetical protein